MKEITKEWINLAADDLATIEKIIDIEHLTNIIAFHSQQCIEKIFKAILEEYELKISKIHDLITLYSKIKNIINFRVEKDLLDILSKVYIESRYPSDLGLLPEGKPSIEEGRRFYIFARDIFNKSKNFLEKNNKEE